MLRDKTNASIIISLQIIKQLTMTDNHVKTIIVGAGPAGCTCGYILAKNNQDCIVIDRKEFPRDKLCGGGLTPKAHILLERVFENIQYDYFKVEKVDLYTYNEFVCSFLMDTEIRNIHRKEFDHLLLKEYQKLGGQIITDTVVRIEEAEDKKFILLKSGKKLSCDYLIGADGANSVVRRYLEPNFSKGFVLLEKYIPDRTMTDLRVYFDRKIKRGYLYLFPNKEGYAVGYGGENTTLDVFEESLSHLKIRAEAKTKGAYLPMCSTKLKYPFRKDIILVGDAGGYADAMTGEGLYFAMKSGENAAISIVENVDFKMQNKDVIETIKKRKIMAEIFYFAPVTKLFMYMCKKASLLRRINRRVNEALSN